MEFLVNASESLFQINLRRFSLYNGFNDRLFHQWLQDNEYIVWLFILSYLLIVYIGPKLAQNLKPLNLASTVILWNSIVAIFSIIIAVYTCMERYEMLTVYGWKDSLCYMEHHTGPIAFWSGTFVLSKFILLGDTLILMLRKRRKVMFSHWFHHATVCWVAWDMYGQNQALCRWLGAVNSGILALSYSAIALLLKFPKMRKILSPIPAVLACIEVNINIF